MEDLELRDLSIKVLIFLIVFFVFGGLFILVITKKFVFSDVSIGSRIDKEDTFLLLIVNEDTKNTSVIEYLNDNNLDIEIVNSDRERFYNDFLIKLNITKDDLVEPSLIDIREGKVISILVSVKKNKELKEFINSYKEVYE